MQYEVDARRAAVLMLICRSLSGEVRGLDGRRASLLEMVRYGVNGLTLKEIKPELDKIMV